MNMNNVKWSDWGRGERYRSAMQYAESRGMFFGYNASDVTPDDKDNACCGCSRSDVDLICQECAESAASYSEMSSRQDAGFCNKVAGWDEEQFDVFSEHLQLSIAKGVKEMLVEKMKDNSFFLKSIGA